jgi:thiamine pyrophosphokinase
MEQSALVFTGGKGPEKGFNQTIIPTYSYICAADSGLDTANALGFTPDFAIGDFDSLSSLQELEKIAHETHPKDKNLTDTELLLMHVKEKGFTSYTLIGGGEGRLDHLLHLYSLFEQYGPPVIWFTAAEILYCVHKEITLDLPVGTTCSIIPALPSGSSEVFSQGLFWELDHYTIDSQSQSISNKTRVPQVSLYIHGSPVFCSLPL